jgi:glycosyltransferase involved in cell wall biosynthesis
MRILAVTNMYPTPASPFLGTFVEQQVVGLREAGVEVDVLFVDRFHKGWSQYLTLSSRVRDSVKRFQPDIVHAMYGGVLADSVTRTVVDRPVVVTFHGSDLLGENLSGNLRKLIARYGVLSSHRAARRANGVVVVSRALDDVLRKAVGERNVRIIPCGIDVERFKPLDRDACRSRLGWKEHRFHILFASSSGNAVKRPELAVAAVKVLDGSEVDAEIHFLSGVPHADVPMWINASDVLLLTSLHEGSPTVVKEALACNVPVVSVDVGDVRERIDGIDGCHLGLPEPHDLAEKLRLVHAAGRRIAGRERALSLSLQLTALRLAEFYSDILGTFVRERRIA